MIFMYKSPRQIESKSKTKQKTKKTTKKKDEDLGNLVANPKARAKSSELQKMFSLL